jgi:hypothetical protein
MVQEIHYNRKIKKNTSSFILILTLFESMEIISVTEIKMICGATGEHVYFYVSKTIYYSFYWKIEILDKYSVEKYLFLFECFTIAILIFSIIHIEIILLINNF